MNKPLLFLDLETTGVNIVTDRIVQIAMVKVFPNRERVEKKALINPTIHIPAASTKIHGITDDMVKDAPTFKAFSKGIFDFTVGCDLAGYNSDRYDIPLLIEEFGRVGMDWPEKGTKTIDVLQLERIVTSHTLAETYKRYTGKDLDGAHDAIVDVRATIEILNAQLAILEKDKLKDKPSDIDNIAGIYNNGVKSLDFAGNFYEMDGIAFWNFGKHKGRKLDHDLGYCDWFLSNDFSIESKRILPEYLKQKKPNSAIHST